MSLLRTNTCDNTNNVCCLFAMPIVLFGITCIIRYNNNLSFLKEFKNKILSYIYNGRSKSIAD